MTRFFASVGPQILIWLVTISISQTMGSRIRTKRHLLSLNITSFKDLLEARLGTSSSALDIDDVEIWCWTPERGPDNYLTLKINDSDAKERLAHHNFTSSRQTKIIVNGFNSRPQNHFPPYVRAYFAPSGRPVNILAINWRNLSRFNYISAVYNSAKVGQTVGDFFAKLLLQDMNVSPDHIHIIGHSLGAHVAGHMGRTMEEVGGKGKVARITALDPAAPGFSDTRNRVQPSDAKLLDVIHSNGGHLMRGQYSIVDSIGHVDFYPNGGQRQPGCGVLRDVAVYCSHRRAHAYYIESIAYVGHRGKFLSRACDGYQAYQNNGTGCYDYFLNMGEGLKRPKTRSYTNLTQQFYLDTHHSSPYSH